MNDAETKIEKLKSVILLLLDCVDSTQGSCSVTEMVAAVLPQNVINGARSALIE
jgi:hypothetical protein